MGWTKKISYISLFVLLTITLIACSISYSFTGGSIDYTKVKTISIADFPIRSDYVYTPLMTRFNEELKQIFIRQTKLELVNRGGDLELEGEITGYRATNEAVAADGFASKVRLTVTVNVRYVNNTNHAEDFEQQFTAFRVDESNQLLTQIQDPLIEEMVKEIADQIFNATVANW